MMKFRLNAEFCLWWLASLLLILSTDSYWFERSARVIAALHQDILSTGNVWQLPLTLWSSTEAFAVWPFWLFGVCAAIVPALVAQRMAATNHRLLAVMLLVGVSLALKPDQLVAGLCVLLTCRVVAKPWTDSTATLVFTVALLLGISVAVTLDFGFVAMILLTAASSPIADRVADDKTSRRRLPIITAVLATTLVCFSLLFGGFAAALLRPFSWSWLDTGLMPSLRFLSGGPHDMVAHGLTGLVILATAGCLLRSQNTPVATKLVSFVLAAIGVGCGRYTAVVAIALCELESRESHPGRQTSSPGIPSRLWLPCGCLLVAFVQWGWLLADDGTSAIGGSSQSRLVHPESWRFQGPVMLTNLDQASDWQTAALRHRFPLLLDDRWDAHADSMHDYTEATRDMLDGLREFYLQSDGTDGGYNTFLKIHKPAAIVVDSRDLDAIRHLSVDPEWRVMSIDSRRTILGLSESIHTGAQTRRAGKLFFQMEWPKPGVNIPLDGTLALGTASDSRAVAMVLTAMRLPYAALRILPDDDAGNTESVRTWCYVELAHRSLRHTGQPSLLDQFRAVVRLRQMQSSQLSLGREREKILRALASLENKDIQTDLPVPLTQQISESEQFVRSAIRQGHLAEGMARCVEIEPVSLRQFYQCLLSSNDDLLVDTGLGLQAALDNQELPRRIREEALFYCGCIELELRNADEARRFFDQSHEINPNSRLSALRAQYLTQLKP